MRRVGVGLALALSLLACGSSLPRGEQVPLLTEKGARLTGGGILMHQVIDVVADGRTGTPLIATNDGPMRWPEGFTAWRVGSEVEVLDPQGRRVLVTGGRYLFRCSSYVPYWVISDVRPCPDCKLGFELE